MDEETKVEGEEAVAGEVAAVVEGNEEVITPAEETEAEVTPEAQDPEASM